MRDNLWPMTGAARFRAHRWMPWVVAAVILPAPIAFAGSIASSYQSPTNQTATFGTAPGVTAALTQLGSSDPAAVTVGNVAQQPDLLGGGTPPTPVIAPPAAVRVRQVSANTSYDVPAAALKAYHDAAASVAISDPSCHLSWGVLAAIGQVESDHGRYGGAVVLSNGETWPTILGPLLDGSPGVGLVLDTDGGRLDGNATWDRAVGPMQFIPSSWASAGADGDHNGTRDPNNFNDAALAAARYLCASGADMAVPAQARGAVLTYNHSPAYADLVLTLANSYNLGVASVVPSPTSPPSTFPAQTTPAAQSPAGQLPAGQPLGRQHTTSTGHRSGTSTGHSTHPPRRSHQGSGPGQTTVLAGPVLRGQQGLTTGAPVRHGEPRIHIPTKPPVPAGPPIPKPTGPTTPAPTGPPSPTPTPTPTPPAPPPTPSPTPPPSAPPTTTDVIGVLAGSTCPTTTTGQPTCTSTWTLDGNPLDLGPDPDLSVVQGDYNGDGTAAAVQDELSTLVGHHVTVTLDDTGLVVKINGLGYAQTRSATSGVWTSCGQGWCLDGQPVDLGTKPHLSQVQGDYDGNGVALPARREFKRLIGQQVTVTIDLATGLVVQINGLDYLAQPAATSN